MYQMANPVTDWGKGEAASTQGVGKTSPGDGLNATTSPTS